MKFDWDCAREVLFALEAQADNTVFLRSDDVNVFDDQKVAYHMQLLVEAGLIVGQCILDMDNGLHCHASRMTWSGHQLLDSIRNTGVWNKVKTLAREKGISLTLDVVTALAKHVMESILK